MPSVSRAHRAASPSIPAIRGRGGSPGPNSNWAGANTWPSLPGVACEGSCLLAVVDHVPVQSGPGAHSAPYTNTRAHRVQCKGYTVRRHRAAWYNSFLLVHLAALLTSICRAGRLAPSRPPPEPYGSTPPLAAPEPLVLTDAPVPSRRVTAVALPWCVLALPCDVGRAGIDSTALLPRLQPTIREDIHTDATDG